MLTPGTAVLTIHKILNDWAPAIDITRWQLTPIVNAIVIAFVNVLPYIDDHA